MSIFAELIIYQSINNRRQSMSINVQENTLK
jgi:hypothetical protein